MKNYLIILATVSLMSSCGTSSVFNQRSSGINGITGAHTITKTQAYYNKEASDKRFKRHTSNGFIKDLFSSKK